MTLRYDSERGWTFAMPDGTRRVIRDPDGAPTCWQLMKLLHAGRLSLRAEPGPKLTKLECARAIDAANERQEA